MNVAIEYRYLYFDTELFFCCEASPALPFNDDGNKKNKKTSNVKLRVMTLCIKNTKNNKSNNQTN